VQYVDVREVFLPINGQEVVTSDSVSVKLSLLARYRVADPIVAVTKVESYIGALHSLIQVALREVVTTKTIDELLANRSQIGPGVLAGCAEDLKTIGLELLAVDVRDLMFPGALKKTFAQVLEAKQQGLAALEKARGETAALRTLANAARMVEANPALLQLRLIEQLESTRGHTIVMGLPSTSTPVPVRSPGAAGTELPEGGGEASSGD
jgi:regulator of protease activity HflC (stomatin/prohibitin superfamily)